MVHETGQSQVVKETQIIDTDVHIRIPAEEIANYADDEYTDRIMSPVAYPKQAGLLWDTRMGGKFIRDDWGFTDTNDVDEFRTEFHIETPIMNPLATLDRVPDPDLAEALMKGINDAFFDIFRRPDDDAIGQIQLTTHNPDKAAEEIDRWGDEDQIVGAMITNAGTYPPVGDPEYDILYQAAEDNDLTISYHSAAAQGVDVDFPRYYHGLNSFPAVHSVAHVWNQQLAVSSLITEGVPEKFPDLNFCFLEAGFLWVPDLMWRLNKEWTMRREEIPLVQKKPESYIKEQFFFNSQPLGEPMNQEQLEHLIKAMGIDSIMFGSDYPHWDIDHPIELGKHMQAHFSPEERQEVFYDTPAEAYNIS